jgi:hypothetical protein
MVAQQQERADRGGAGEEAGAAVDDIDTSGQRPQKAEKRLAGKFRR